MDVPAPLAGTVLEVKVKKGSRVNAGDPVAVVRPNADAAAATASAGAATPDAAAKRAQARPPDASAAPASGRSPAATPAPLRAPLAGRRKSRAPQARPRSRPLRRRSARRTRARRSASSRASSASSSVACAARATRTASRPTTSRRSSRRSCAAVLRRPPRWPRRCLRCRPSTSRSTVAIETEPLTPDPEDLGAAPARELGEHPARHAARRSRHHRARGAPRGAQGHAQQRGIKLTPLAFIIRAVALALAEMPLFNSSLAPDGENLVIKKYTHIGFAADTPNGLVVPVIRDADKKDIYELAKSLATLSDRARTGKLQAGRHPGRRVHGVEPRRHRRQVLHADHQRARGRDPRRVAQRVAAGLSRHGVRAAADPAALARLRSSRDRRREGRALHDAARRDPCGRWPARRGDS